jgi:hypothetical protein
MVGPLVLYEARCTLIYMRRWCKIESVHRVPVTALLV